jgi:hypothetical protein
MDGMDIKTLWESQNEQDWRDALDDYWQIPSVKRNISLERLMCRLDADAVRALGPREWYEFLREEYFRWKFTECKHLLKNQTHLWEYEKTNTLSDLASIRDSLFEFDLRDISEGLERAEKIHGLSWSAGSGLLAVLFPKWFGTVDRFVVKSLYEIESLPERQRVLAMVRVSKGRQVVKTLSQKDAVLLIAIMRRKAAELNVLFGRGESDPQRWTPREIDMILFASRPQKARSKGALKLATAKQIRFRAIGNLSTLKLSVMTKAQVRYEAERLARKWGRRA